MSSQREALAEVLWESIDWGKVPASLDASVGGNMAEMSAEQADTVISHLWSRADDPEVVEAVAKGMMWLVDPPLPTEGEFTLDDYWEGANESSKRISIRRAERGIPALLTALLGPRPNGEEAEHG